MTTFWEAVERKKQGLPIIRTEHPEGYKFIMSLQQNEMVTFNTTENINDSISNKLYRVQKMTKKTSGTVEVVFRHHLETNLIDNDYSKLTNRFLYITSINHLPKFDKTKISILGKLF